MLQGGCLSRAAPEACLRLPLSLVSSELTDRDYGRLQSPPRANAARENEAFQYFQQSCPDLSRRPIGRLHGNNLVCRIEGSHVDGLPGKDTVVVGAHFDRIGPGSGVADNWSGIMLISRLMEEIRLQQPRLTWLVIAFGAEESALRGSTRYVRELNHEDTIAMINVDTLGLGVVKFDHRSDELLKCIATDLAAELDIHARGSRLAQVTGDWEPFRRKDIPVLAIHSLDRRDLKKVHTRKDSFNGISKKGLQDAWLLLLNLYRYIDSSENLTPE